MLTKRKIRVYDFDKVVKVETGSSVFAVRLFGSICPESAATWGYHGGCPGEERHIEELFVEALWYKESCGEKITERTPFFDLLETFFERSHSRGYLLSVVDSQCDVVI